MNRAYTKLCWAKLWQVYLKLHRTNTIRENFSMKTDELLAIHQILHCFVSTYIHAITHLQVLYHNYYNIIHACTYCSYTRRHKYVNMHTSAHVHILLSVDTWWVTCIYVPTCITKYAYISHITCHVHSRTHNVWTTVYCNCTSIYGHLLAITHIF